MPLPNLSDLGVISFILVLIVTSGKLVSLGQAISRSLESPGDGSSPGSPPADSARQ